MFLIGMCKQRFVYMLLEKKQTMNGLLGMGDIFFLSHGHILWNLQNANYAYFFEIFK